MAGKPGHGGKAGRSGAPGRTRPAGPGRLPRKATLAIGASVKAAIAEPGGFYGDIGAGQVVEVLRIGRSDWIVKVLLADGGKLVLTISAASGGERNT